MLWRIKNKNRYGEEEYGRISLFEINKALDSNRVTDTEKLVLKKYHDVLQLFHEFNANRPSRHQL